MSIIFKIGTYIQQELGEIGRRSRSQEHIMYVAKICLNSVPGGPINFILGGWHYDDPPTTGA